MHPDHQHQTKLPAHRPKIRVLIVDDLPAVHQHLLSLLRPEPDIEIVGYATDGQQAVKLARKLAPDVIIMDGEMPILKGIEATRQILRELPQIRVVGFSLHTGNSWITAMLHAGAQECLAKNCESHQLLAAIRVHRGTDEGTQKHPLGQGNP